MVEREAALVFVAVILAIAGGLLAILTPLTGLALTVCLAGLVPMLACFYLT